MKIIFYDKNPYSYPIDALESDNTNGASKRSIKISANIRFFKSGTCCGKTLITVVKTLITVVKYSIIQSTIKILEPDEQIIRSTFKLVRDSSNILKTYKRKEFGMPAEVTSVHYLKKHLCLGFAEGFQVVTLETLKIQALLHPEDSFHDFNLPSLLLRKGLDKLITWKGTPNSFAFHSPYVFAFEPSFIEIRHIETGLLEQFITEHNIRYLCSNPRISTVDALCKNSTLTSLVLRDNNISFKVESNNSSSLKILQ
ncbi:5145_t:CDS:2 [Cetraspora pellucida]|uniref:5145_t:CDS:1 n=1 Tax=Cetraspora pellucida TaxID=1433469 RepID=A0A9N9NJ99_9GLOM|nr:5145_t:CDS:2 [Cetraspora pellucida]